MNLERHAAQTKPGDALRHARETNQLTALAASDALLDWRFALTFEALHTAGVLDALPGTPAELSRPLGLGTPAVDACLHVLVAWGVVERRADGAYAWAEPALSDDEILTIAQHGVWIRRWAALIGPRLADRDAPSPLNPPGLPPATGLRLLGLATAPAVAPVTELCVQALAPRVSGRVLDLGGGHGAYARALAAAGLEVTLQDLPPVVEQLRTDPANAELRLAAEDMHRGLADGPFDLVLCSTVTNMFDPPTVRAILARVAEALDPGGVAVLVSYLREQGQPGAAFGVQMLVATPGGDAHGLEDYRRWLAEAGLRLEQVRHLDRPALSVLVARRPL